MIVLRYLHDIFNDHMALNGNMGVYKGGLLTSLFPYKGGLRGGYQDVLVQPDASVDTAKTWSLPRPAAGELNTYFHQLSPSWSRSCHVRVCVCLSVCLRHRVQFFSQRLIGPEIT